MESRFDAAEANRFVDRYGARWGNDLALRVYTSRLLGAEPALVLHGGGNTSVKTTAREVTGETVDVLYVKGSGWDLSTIEPAGFPACRLAPLRRFCQLESMTDEQMVAALRGQMLDPASPTPSVEALLHAFLPGRYVDHTHANAVLSVVDQPDGAKRVRELWPEGLLFVPYVMPGFALARAIVELGEPDSSTHIMVLDKHGIFTWGETAEESYRRMIEAVTHTERYVARAVEQVPSAVASGSAERIHAEQRRLSPLIRGALGRAPDGRPLVVEWRTEPHIMELVARNDAERLSTIGTITPDHVIRTKPFPAWLGQAPGDEAQARAHVETALSSFASFYERYFAENAARHREPLTRLDRLPKLLLAAGAGLATVGKTRAEARIAGDIYAHTAGVILAAASMSGYCPVPLADLFDVEYWSLEQAKLALTRSAPSPLSGRIALVTGAARGIGLATAEHLLELGSHVMVSDRDGAQLEQTMAALGKRFRAQVAACAADVTSDSEVARLVDATVLAFGGLDIVVSNAGTAPSGRLDTEEGDRALRRSLEVNLLGHQTVARAAVELMLSQGTGGSLLFNASKSAFNPGKDFGPYAVPKAAVVALMRQYAVDLGEHGIRANAVNADRVKTELFSEELIVSRARARGVSPDQYFRENILRRETTAQDVARAFGYLATAEATTGCVLTVDGGNAAAFPR